MVTGVQTGRQTLASIEKALGDVSETATRLNAELEKANQDKAKLVAQRLEAFRELAQFRAQLAVVDGVIDEADQLNLQVRGVLQARQKTVTALKRRSAQASTQREQLIAEQGGLDKQIDQLEKKLDAAVGRARAELSQEPTYSGHSKRHDELLSMVKKASAKAEKSHDELEAKGAPYRGDRLFMYLWNRKYGTSEYEATGVVRWLDDWVARLVGYPDARANFTMLTDIPERLDEHVGRLKKTLQVEQDAVDKIEGKKIREIVGAELDDKMQELRKQREASTANLEALNAEVIETDNQLKRYAEGQDASFQEAIESTTSFLEGQSLSALLADARQTNDPGDDKIVNLIGNLAGAITSLEELAKTKSEALEAAFARKQELLRIAAGFRRAGYDEPGSVFQPGSGGETLLNQLLQGLITAAEYWARTQSGHRWRGRSGDGYRRGSSSSGGRSSRDDSGPEFRTGGEF
ncbi:MAG: hypothetical protein SGJ17_05765 [Hyphomicrobiales bacterium]|nr:hypothetical protein [Hyphomicrobiales bacterium]